MPDRNRLILHLDLDAFFCSVEELLRPELKGMPFAVGAPAEHRGVLSTASYAARAYGIHSAMPTARAIQLLPGLIVLPSRYDVYADYSQRVMDILNDTAPIVEPLSIDEAFLDCTGDPHSGREIGTALKLRILEETGLRCTVGAAANKLVAKIATNQGKPDGLTIVRAGEEAAFLAPLPLRELWGVGPKTQAALQQLGMQTVSDLARWPPEDLARRFGRHGRSLAERARGLDDSPVSDAREAKSISKETTFSRDTADETVLRRTLRELADGVAASLREENISAKTVRLKIRWPPFITQTRQVSLPNPTHSGEEIFQSAWSLFRGVWKTGRPVRLIGVGTGNLVESGGQLPLFTDPKAADLLLLESTIDGIRKRYGKGAVRRASSLRKKLPPDDPR